MFKSQVTVSVPFRGCDVSNGHAEDEKNLIEISVPFRSFDVSNGLPYKAAKHHDYLFPSPSGVLMFLTNVNQVVSTALAGSFPSPSGALMFLTGYRLMMRLSYRLFPSPSGALMFLTNLKMFKSQVTVSVPFRGFDVSNKYSGKPYGEKTRGFRPLPGL